MDDIKTRFNATIKTDFDELKKLSADVDTFLQQPNVPEEPRYRIELALEEMVSNVIKYGYDTPARHDIKVTLTVTEIALVLIIEDWGHEFNPLNANAPRLDEDISVRPIGGVGIHLTRSMCSSIDYQRNGNRNVLTITVNMQHLNSCF